VLQAVEIVDPVATPIVARMDDLFAIDTEARRKVFGITGRHGLGQERAMHLLDDIRNKIAARSNVLSLTSWHGPTRRLHDAPFHYVVDKSRVACADDGAAVKAFRFSRFV
jgi:hypothetical protein